jgi:hypothetical protein
MKWTDHKRSLVVSIVALKDIVKDGEICVHYGAHHDLPTGRQPCHCNAPGCVARNKKRTQNLRPKHGKQKRRYAPSYTAS